MSLFKRIIVMMIVNEVRNIYILFFLIQIMKKKGDILNFKSNFSKYLIRWLIIFFFICIAYYYAKSRTIDIGFGLKYVFIGSGFSAIPLRSNTYWTIVILIAVIFAYSMKLLKPVTKVLFD